MVEQAYDPAARKARYEATKQLTGRGKGSANASSASPPHPKKSVANPYREQALVSQDRVIRVRTKVNKLKSALSEVESELSTRRQTSRAAKKASSDDKATVDEKQASQDHRDKHKTELATKSKKSISSSGGGSKSSSNSVADMSTKALEDRVIKIKSAIRDARRLLSSASIEHGQLMHSALASDPDVNERFARYTSAERGPST